MPRASSARSLQRHLQAVINTDPVASARAVGLRYVNDDAPGIGRKKVGKNFRYISPTGERIEDEETLARIKSLVIPPAWEDVWICPLPNGHLQATGRDAKGRKQYRYHPQWRQIRDQTKFTRMLAFSAVLPQVRQRIEQDLSRRGLPKEKVLAAVLRLMELTRIRVGNEEYAKTNDSFGLTTLRDQHVDISGGTIRFQFRGKSGVEHDIELSDRRLARIVKQCQDIPGQELFQYIDENGDRQTIDSGDVNDYLREMSGQDFTAKDFRTWAGTILAARELHGIGSSDTQTQAKKNVTQAVKIVAHHLGNRPATCRKYYIHPAILEAYLQGTLPSYMERQVKAELESDPCGLRSEELAVVALIEEQLIQELQQPKAS